MPHEYWPVAAVVATTGAPLVEPSRRARGRGGRGRATWVKQARASGEREGRGERDEPDASAWNFSQELRLQRASAHRNKSPRRQHTPKAGESTICLSPAPLGGRAELSRCSVGHDHHGDAGRPGWARAAVAELADRVVAQQAIVSSVFQAQLIESKVIARVQIFCGICDRRRHFRRLSLPRSPERLLPQQDSVRFGPARRSCGRWQSRPGPRSSREPTCVGLRCGAAARRLSHLTLVVEPPAPQGAGRLRPAGELATRAHGRPAAGPDLHRARSLAGGAVSQLPVARCHPSTRGSCRS